MAAELFLVRHGQSTSNAGNVFCGRLDFDLTKLGVNQADAAGRRLADKGICAIYSSPLLRALNTSREIEKYCGCGIILDDRLMELDVGLWSGLTPNEVKDRFPESYAVWCGNVGRTECDGGESVSQLLARVCSAVHDIATKHDGKKVCIVTHCMAIRALCGAQNGLDGIQRIDFVKNASITHALYENGKLRVECYGGM